MFSKRNQKMEMKKEVKKEKKYFEQMPSNARPKSKEDDDDGPAAKRSKPEDETRDKCGKHEREIELLTVKLIQEQKKFDRLNDLHQRQMALLMTDTVMQKQKITKLQQKLKEKESDYNKQVEHLKSILSSQKRIMNKLPLPKNVKEEMICNQKNALLWLKMEQDFCKAVTERCESTSNNFLTNDTCGRCGGSATFQALKASEVKQEVDSDITFIGCLSTGVDVKPLCSPPFHCILGEPVELD